MALDQHNPLGAQLFGVFQLIEVVRLLNDAMNQEAIDDFLPRGATHRQPQGSAVRPKLLFLAQRFPPANTSACVRTSNIAKYLVRLGWDVTVVTSHPATWRSVEDADIVTSELNEARIKRVLTGHNWRFLQPNLMNCRDDGMARIVGGICRVVTRRLGIDKGIGWIKPAERACSALTPSDVDVIFASGKPFAAFTLAKRLSKKLGRPFVLDYRDPWTETEKPNSPSYTKMLRDETKLLADCAAVTIVSPSLASAMEGRFKLGPKLHVVTNGFDPSELAAVKPHNFGHFAIVYTGIFYPPKRIITPLMAALRRLSDGLKVKPFPEWSFHYYGSDGSHVSKEAERFGLRDRVILHGSVRRSECLSAVKGAGLAVVVTTVNENATLEDRGIVTGKVFEPLGLGTPILLIAPAGSDVQAIVEDAALGRRYSGTDIEGIASFIKERMLEPALSSSKVQLYSWPHMARKLDTLLRHVTTMPIADVGQSRTI